MCSQQYNLDITDGNQALLVSRVRKKVPNGTPQPDRVMLIPELCYLTGLCLCAAALLLLDNSAQVHKHGWREQVNRCKWSKFLSFPRLDEQNEGRLCCHEGLARSHETEPAAEGGAPQQIYFRHARVC